MASAIRCYSQRNNILYIKFNHAIGVSVEVSTALIEIDPLPIVLATEQLNKKTLVQSGGRAAQGLPTAMH